MARLLNSSSNRSKKNNLKSFPAATVENDYGENYEFQGRRKFKLHTETLLKLMSTRKFAKIPLKFLLV